MFNQLIRHRCTPALLLILLAACHGAPSGDQTPQMTATKPMAIDTPPPEYPLELACAGISGVAELKLSIGIDGRPADVQIAQGSGAAELDNAAVTAVRNWRFEPATANGKPKPSTINVPVKFSLPKVLPDACNKINEERRRAAQ